MKRIFYYLQSIENCKKMEIELPKNIKEHCSKYEGERFTTSVLSYSLLEFILKKFGRNIREIRFSNNGKPLIEGGYVSISHSNDYIFVSFGDVNHGIDIQCVDHKIKKEKIMTKYFPSYLNQFKELNEEEKDDLFYKLWTKKEAYTKCYDLNILDVSEVETANHYVFKMGPYFLCICSEEEVEIENI